MVYKTMDHDFSYPQFAWAAQENYQPCIKLSFFFRKSPTVTDAFFQKHYNHVHSDLTVACKKFHAVKVARYVQLYQSPDLKGKLKELGMDVLDYDACSQIWVRKWEDWEAFVGSEEYRAALMSDAEKFMDLERGIQVMAGHDMICFGKAIPDCDAKDGITREEAA